MENTDLLPASMDLPLGDISNKWNLCYIVLCNRSGSFLPLEITFILPVEVMCIYYKYQKYSRKRKRRNIHI
jgi:hypothetical protein